VVLTKLSVSIINKKDPGDRNLLKQSFGGQNKQIGFCLTRSSSKINYAKFCPLYFVATLVIFSYSIFPKSVLYEIINVAAEAHITNLVN